MPHATLVIRFDIAIDVLRLWDKASLGLRNLVRVLVSPFLERKEGTVISAEATDASVVSSPLRWDISVSPEKIRFDPFMSLLI